MIHLFVQAWNTPVFWMSIVPAVLSSPHWILVGIAGVVLRLVFSLSIYLSHSAVNAGHAAEYTAELRKSYRGELKKLSDLIPELAERYPSSSTIYVKVAKPMKGCKPLTHFSAYTMPAHRTAIAFIGDSPSKLGGVLYFQALHEIGHALFSGQSHTLNRIQPVLQTGIVYFPILQLVYWWPFMLAIVAMAIWHHWLSNRVDFAEISADQFAIQAFDDTRGSSAREKAVRALCGYWRDSPDREKLQRIRFLEDSLEYAPSSQAVGSADWLRYTRQTNEISTDGLALGIIEKVATGPVLMSAVVVLIFWLSGSGDQVTANAESVAIFAFQTLLLPVALFACIGLFAKRQVRRQSVNVAWILATSEYEHLLDVDDR